MLVSIAFAFCMFQLILVTVESFVIAPALAARLHQGSQMDTGIFPKRSTNVNAWSLSTANDTSTEAYPILFPQTLSGVSTAYQAGLPARINIAKTTACPIFRAQDDGSTDPVLIG